MERQTIGMLLAAAVVSLVHGLLPNHWLPFVLIAKAQGWDKKRMLWVLCAAGTAHVAVAGGIALITLLLGLMIEPFIKPLAHIVAPGIMIVFGLAFILFDLLTPRHHHHDLHEAARTGMSDATAVISLVLSLALSPCEAMIPVFVSASTKANPFLLLGMVIVSGFFTVGVMALLATLSYKGLMSLHFGRFATKERTLIGLVLLLLGIIAFIFEHLHHQ